MLFVGSRLFAAENPDVFWFPAQVPETYSYTLSLAMTTGLPIVASDLGALPERLAHYPQVVIVPWNAPISLTCLKLAPALAALDAGRHDELSALFS